MLDMIKRLVWLTSSTTDEKGFITTMKHATGESREEVGGKSLVVHEQYQLSGAEDPTWQTRMLFNPLSENVTSTTITPSLEWLMRGVTFRMNVTFMALIKEVLRVAASPKEHEHLTPEQLEFVTKLVEVDAPVADFFDKTIATLAAKGEYTFIKLFPKHAGQIGTVKYSRTCHVSFPIYEELTGERKFGKSTALPKGASAKLAMVMQLFLPDISIQDGYSSGSNSRMAPFFESFIASVMKLYTAISRHQRTWADLWPKPEVDQGLANRFGIVEYQWLDYLRNTDALVDEIRALPNPGVVAAQPAVVAQAFAQVDRPPVQQAPQQYQVQTETRSRFDPAPQQQTNRQLAPGTTGMTLEEIRRQRNTNSHYYDDRGGYDRRDSGRYNNNGGGSWAR